MFQIRVVQHFFSLACLKEGCAEVFNRAHQCIHQRCGAAAVLIILGSRADKDIVLNGRHLLFGPVAQV